MGNRAKPSSGLEPIADLNKTEDLNKAEDLSPIEGLSQIEYLTQKNVLFKVVEADALHEALAGQPIVTEKLYSNRPVYTAFKPDTFLNDLYGVVSGGPVVVHSTPLDRIIAMTYPGGCFGMRDLPFDFGQIDRAFPSLVEAYKTTDVVKIPGSAIATLYKSQPQFRERWALLLEQRAKFQYHLLNCSSYPPQAVAALLRALIYQERSLGLQPQSDDHFIFDLPVDLLTRACQLNQRTVEQVLKGMQQIGLIQTQKSTEVGDLVIIINSEGLKEVYSATRDKVSWWPLR